MEKGNNFSNNLQKREHGVGKTTLAKKIADSWKCILIDDTDLLNTHIENKTKEGLELRKILSEGKSIPEDKVLELILARLNSSDVEHYDKDLVQKLSGLKQYPETGQVYSRDQWEHENVYINKKESKDEEIEDEEEKAAEEDLGKDMIDQMVWIPENLAQNASVRITMYRDTMLRPLESVMSRLGSMAIKRVSIPILLHQTDDEELPEDVGTEMLLRILSSSSAVAPGFRWRRSRWGQTCPVALKEGKIIPGKPEFSVGFQDKVYILSSQEAYQKFVTNPRRYLVLQCPGLLVGFPSLGLLKQGRAPYMEDADTDREVRTGWVLDSFPKNVPQMNALQQGETLPDILFCLTDSGGTQVLKRLYEMNKESVDEAVRKRLQIEQSRRTNWSYNSKQSESTSPVHPDMTKEDAVILPDQWELGYPDGPEMKDYKLQLQQFVSGWEQMQSALSIPCIVLEIDGKSPEDLLQEMVSHMEKPFQYVSWELSAMDLEEEAEDMEALAELERAEEGSNDNDAAEEEEGGMTAKRLLGDTHHFCPVAFKNQNILWPCTDDIAAKYCEKTFYFSSPEARDTFLQNPAQFVAKTEPLKPPALRVFLLGTRGSGKTSTGEWLAQQLGLFHIQFREQLQMLIMAKTLKRVPRADEVESQEESPEDLEALIREAMQESKEEEMEDTSANESDMEQEVELTDEEMAIKAYLSNGDPLTPQILDMVIAPFWKQEPYMSTGFILEGFPHNPEEVQYMLQEQLFPDIVVIMSVDVTDVQKRLLPTYLDKWCERQNRREAQLNLLRDLRKTNREKRISKRRAELLEERGGTAAKTEEEEDEDEDEDEEEDSADNIEAILEEEFPPEEDNEDTENDETKDAAAERLETEIEERYVTDENYLVTVTELLSEQNIPSISISGSRKLRNVQLQLLQKIQPLVTNRESLFQKCQPISYSLAQKLLLSSYKLHSAFGCWDPIKFIYFFASKENRNTFMLNPLKYVLDGFPMTLKQAELMSSRSIIPMVVAELQLDTIEVLKRGLEDKMKPNKPHLMHDSSEILHIRNSRYKQEVEMVRKHYQQEYQNWIQLDGLKSKWWLWNSIIKEVSISMRYIHSYLDRIQRGQAACINRLCITPKELHHGLGEFGQYCPVCLALHHHLMDCSEVTVLTHAAEYKGRYYKICGEDHLEKFLSTPDQFVTPGCPYTLPQPQLLPRKLTEIQVKNKFPQQIEMKGFCPITYLDGKQRYEALVRGKMEYAVEYRERIYIFETKQKQNKFMRTPETYWDQRLPSKVPPLCEPVPLTSLPTLGYLEQGVAVAVIKAMTAVGCFKPKHPFLSIQRSSLLYVALYLKAFNNKSTDYTCQKYKKKLALFEENCALIPYLSSTMRGNYRPPIDQPIDFKFKLNRFLAMEDSSRANCVLLARMSKRRGSSAKESPNKRVRFDQEEEEEEDRGVADRDQDGHLLKQMQRTADVSDAGIVESITLKNFMCHSLLGPFTFGSNVNFVVGNNGSGKSAVLTALIVALGGNAQATNRGSSLKGFVKEGESSADVSITLRNKGRDAYKPEVYGSAIIVDLRITREGLRTYKLRSKSGQIVSTKKEELLSILDNFNIQVNNPVSVLTQEMSKYFLHSKGEGDKYKFFMKATQLEQMREDFVYIKTTKHVTEDKVEQHNECLKDLKRKCQEKEDRYKSLASLDEMHTKLEELQKQMAWALVAEMEKELEPMKEKLRSDRKSTQKYDEKVDEWKNKVEEAEKKYKQIQEQLEGITQQVQELQPKCADLKAESQRRNDLLKSSEVTVHRCKANLRDLEKDNIQLSSRINDLKLSITQSTGTESRARMQRMEQIESELESLNHQISTLGQQIDQYKHACGRAREEKGKMRKEQLVLQRSIDANRMNLNTMESSRSNRLRRFGEHMPALLTAIQEAHKKGQFKHKPRGPLGYLISPKDPEQALALEVCLKGQLMAFTCDNHQDERVLQGLMARVFSSGRRPTIITSQFLPKIHDTRKRAVNHPLYPSVLQALEIEDPVVANCLIDQRNIESILLIKNRTEARRVMQGKNPPQNCIQAFSKEGDQIFTNRVYTAELTRANYLTGDVEEEIRHLKREMENQTAQANRFQQQMGKLDEDIKQNEGLLRRAHIEQKNTKDKATKLQLELTDLKNVEEPQLEDLRPLEEDLQEIVLKISAKRADCEEARLQVADLKASYEKAEREYKQHKEQINTVAEQADSIKEELSEADRELVKCKHHKKHYEEKRSAHLHNIQTLEASLQSKELEFHTSVSKATEICPERVDVRRTARSLDSEISRLKVKISTQQEQQGDREEIVRQYHEALENYKNLAQQMKNLNTFIRSLDSVMNERLQVSVSPL
ncbi:hypothetical protein INR49_004227 [Caranx melampygus]|nr:hypothetical protein INR49_004227 [Caranx melampygus]